MTEVLMTVQQWNLPSTLPTIGDRIVFDRQVNDISPGTVVETYLNQNFLLCVRTAEVSYTWRTITNRAARWAAAPGAEATTEPAERWNQIGVLPDPGRTVEFNVAHPLTAQTVAEVYINGTDTLCFAPVGADRVGASGLSRALGETWRSLHQYPQMQWRYVTPRYVPPAPEAAPAGQDGMWSDTTDQPAPGHTVEFNVAHPVLRTNRVETYQNDAEELCFATVGASEIGPTRSRVRGAVWSSLRGYPGIQWRYAPGATPSEPEPTWHPRNERPEIGRRIAFRNRIMGLSEAETYESPGILDRYNPCFRPVGGGSGWNWTALRDRDEWRYLDEPTQPEVVWYSADQQVPDLDRRIAFDIPITGCNSNEAATFECAQHRNSRGPCFRSDGMTYSWTAVTGGRRWRYLDAATPPEPQWHPADTDYPRPGTTVAFDTQWQGHTPGTQLFVYDYPGAGLCVRSAEETEGNGRTWVSVASRRNPLRWRYLNPELVEVAPDEDAEDEEDEEDVDDDLDTNDEEENVPAAPAPSTTPLSRRELNNLRVGAVFEATCTMVRQPNGTFSRGCKNFSGDEFLSFVKTSTRLAQDRDNRDQFEVTFDLEKRGQDSAQIVHGTTRQPTRLTMGEVMEYTSNWLLQTAASPPTFTVRPGLYQRENAVYSVDAHGRVVKMTNVNRGSATPFGRGTIDTELNGNHRITEFYSERGGPLPMVTLTLMTGQPDPVLAV